MCAGFKVLRTSRLEDTQALYGQIHGHLQCMYASLPRGGRGGAEALLAFSDWIARCKDSTCQTLRDVWIQMLLAAQGAAVRAAIRAAARSVMRPPPDAAQPVVQVRSGAGLLCSL